MKTLSVSKENWRKLRKLRSDLNLKNFNDVVTYLFDIAEEYEKVHPLEAMNRREKIVYNKLIKSGANVFRGYGFPDFYHLKDGNLVVDEVKSENSKLSKRQEQLKSHLIKAGIIYRVWEVNRYGKATIIFDSEFGTRSLDKNRHQIIDEKKEQKNDEEYDGNNDIWDI